MLFLSKKGQFKFLINMTAFSIFKVDCTKVGGSDTLS